MFTQARYQSLRVCEKFMFFIRIRNVFVLVLDLRLWNAFV